MLDVVLPNLEVCRNRGCSPSERQPVLESASHRILLGQCRDANPGLRLLQSTSGWAHEHLLTSRCAGALREWV